MIEFLRPNKFKLIGGLVISVGIYLLIVGISTTVNSQQKNPEYIIAEKGNEKIKIKTSELELVSKRVVITDFKEQKEIDSELFKIELTKIIISLVLGYVFICLVEFYRKEKIG